MKTVTKISFRADRSWFYTITASTGKFDFYISFKIIMCMPINKNTCVKIHICIHTLACTHKGLLGKNDNKCKPKYLKA